MSPGIFDSTRRFSNRVEEYVRYRPRYSAELLPFLKTKIGLTPAHVIADIGSGTGMFSKLFLDNGNTVFGIEPNKEMRSTGEKLLASYPSFKSINGTAENTTLPETCADFVTVAHAFHWFEPKKTKREFLKILKPGGKVILVWNERVILKEGFAAAYEDILLEFGVDYKKVRHDRPEKKEVIEQFFAPMGCNSAEFPTSQVLDLEGLQGRLLSSSYVPRAGDDNYEPMMKKVGQIFDKFNSDGVVVVDYKTRVYYGPISP